MPFLKSARSRWMEFIEAAHVTSRCLELMESAIQIDEIFYYSLIRYSKYLRFLTDVTCDQWHPQILFLSSHKRFLKTVIGLTFDASQFQDVIKLERKIFIFSSPDITGRNSYDKSLRKQIPSDSNGRILTTWRRGKGMLAKIPVFSEGMLF